MELVKQKPTVFIVIPTMETIYSRVRFALAEVMSQNDGDYNADVGQPENYITHHARNWGADKAWKDGNDFIFYMDDDMLFPDGTVTRLVRLANERPDVNIFGGLYSKRGNDFSQLVFKSSNGKMQIDPIEPYTGLYERDGGGTGCLFVRTSLFQRLDFPYFKYTYTEDRQLIGEDINFFLQTSSKGEKVLIDSGLVCIHLGRFGVIPKSKDTVEVRSM